MASELPVSTSTNNIDEFSIVTSGNVLYRDKYQVTSSTTIQNSFYVHDESINESTEISRNTVELNENDTASVSLSSLYQSISQIKTIQPVLKTTPTETKISTISSDNVFNLTLDGSISWDSDEACLYLSANKAFRFRYVASNGTNPSRLVLEGYSDATSTYLPKVEFSTD